MTPRFQLIKASVVSCTWSTLKMTHYLIFNGLTHSKDYTVEVRALGGSTGQSD